MAMMLTMQRVAGEPTRRADPKLSSFLTSGDRRWQDAGISRTQSWVSEHSLTTVCRVTPRAPALPPDQRRAAILRAARPLLLEQAGTFTTRQVAEAAGIAEGTLFRIFGTKRELMQAMISDAMDPTDVCEDLDAIDRSLPLDERVTLVLARMQRAINDVSAVFAALFQIPDADANGLGNPPHHHSPGAKARSEAQSRQLQQAIARVLAGDADVLACSLDEAAALVSSMAFATAHPHVNHHPDSNPHRLARLLLGGLAPTQCTSDKESPC